MARDDKEGLGDGTDWERYAAELDEAWDGKEWPITPEPQPHAITGPRDWVQADLDDETPEAADDVLDATYQAQGRNPLSALERTLLSVAGIGLLLIILSELSIITLSSTLFIVVVIASAGAAVAWVVSYATGEEDDNGMRV